MVAACHQRPGRVWLRAGVAAQTQAVQIWSVLWSGSTVRRVIDLLAHMRVPSGRDPVSKGVRLRLGTANVLTSLDIDRTPAGHRRARDAGVRVTGRAPC